MIPNSPALKAFFEAKAYAYPTNTAPNEIAKLLSADELTPYGCAPIIQKYGLERDGGLNRIFLDWIIEFVQSALTSRPNVTEDAKALEVVKHSLRIREGDFASLRPIEVKAILCEQLVGILEDGLLEEHEELAQLELQRIFSLGYDHYLALTRPLYDAAIAVLRAAIERASPTDMPALSKRLLSLEAVCALAGSQPRSLGGLR